MENGYELLTEKEEMWARMLMDVLEDNSIPCAALPVYGAGLAIQAGKQECLRVYVPSSHMKLACELLEALFSAEILEDPGDAEG